MTTLELTAIIATGILCVLCVICIIALTGTRRQANENKKAIKDIRESIGTVGDSINEKTTQLIERLEKQQFDAENTQRLDALEAEIKQLSGAGDEFGEIEELGDEIELDDLFRELSAMGEVGAEQPQAQPAPQPVPQPEPVLQPEPVPQAAPVPAAEPITTAEPIPQAQPIPQADPIPQARAEEPRKETRYHQGYDIGRSGRKYTAEELNVLIRE